MKIAGESTDETQIHSEFHFGPRLLPANAMSMVSSNFTIDALGNECLGLFHQIYYLLESRDEETDGTLSIDDIEDELGRFKIWADNIGALQPKNKRTSLEYRLREASETRELVQEILEDMKESLTEGNSLLVLSNCSQRNRHRRTNRTTRR